MLLMFVYLVLFFSSGSSLSAKVFPMGVKNLLKLSVSSCVKVVFFVSPPKLLRLSKNVLVVRLAFLTKNV